jgi:hypothetical protein
MNKNQKTLIVGVGATGLAFAINKFSKKKINSFILGGSVLALTIGTYLYLDKKENSFTITIK